MNSKVIENYSKVKPVVFYVPLFILVLFIFFLHSRFNFNANSYINFQKGYFFYINSKLGLFPNVIYNLTQTGDTLVILSILSFYLLYAPAIWEAIITSTIISSLVSTLLKNFFSIPRPAAVFDNNSFYIVGEKLLGHNSLPSGHSITIFTTLSIFLFALMPEKKLYSVLWVFFILFTGFILAITRVGVGAHYPLDVFFGSMVGYFSGTAAVLICKKYKTGKWLENKKYYPILMLALLICIIIMITKIFDEYLPIYFLALATLTFTLYKTSYVYFKK